LPFLFIISFPFSIYNFISLFYLDFYFPFLFGLLFQFEFYPPFISLFSFFLFGHFPPFISLSYLDFYLPFLYGLLFQFQFQFQFQFKFCLSFYPIAVWFWISSKFSKTFDYIQNCRSQETQTPIRLALFHFKKYKKFF